MHTVSVRIFITLPVTDTTAPSCTIRTTRADLIGGQVFDFGRLHPRKRPAPKAMEIAVAGMGADADAARFRKLAGLAHDVGIAGMKAAGDVDGGGKLDHGGVVAHFPCAKSFAEIAIEIDGLHVWCPFLASGSLVNPRPALRQSIKSARFRRRRR